jgi:hypothetical protein
MTRFPGDARLIVTAALAVAVIYLPAAGVYSLLQWMFGF